MVIEIFNISEKGFLAIHKLLSHDYTSGKFEYSYFILASIVT